MYPQAEVECARCLESRGSCSTRMCGLVGKVAGHQVACDFVLALETRTHRAWSKSSCARSLGIRQFSDDFKCLVSSGEKDGNIVVCLAKERRGDLDEATGASAGLIMFPSLEEMDKELTSLWLHVSAIFLKLSWSLLSPAIVCESEHDDVTCLFKNILAAAFTSPLLATNNACASFLDRPVRDSSSFTNSAASFSIACATLVAFINTVVRTRRQR